MSKSPDAFRTISEVADWLGVQAHVLRFWESRFNQVKPVKRAGGRRYYRPNDMRLLGGIKKLLHEDGITIKGVQRILREQGVAHVASLSQSLSETSAPEQAVADTVVPFAPRTAPDAAQIELEMDAPAPEAEQSAQSDTPATQDTGQTSSTDDTPQTPPRGPVSQVWGIELHDHGILRQIAPIARDLRVWLDRVDHHGTGTEKRQ